jgi:anti-sigma B factor antagonist
VTRPAVVEIEDGLDLSTVVRWEAEVAKAATRTRTVVLDLAGVDFVDSAGVHGLFRMLASLDGQGKRLVLVAPRGGRIRRVLEILDVPALAGICETRAEALERERV